MLAPHFLPPPLVQFTVFDTTAQSCGPMELPVDPDGSAGCLLDFIREKNPALPFVAYLARNGTTWLDPTSPDGRKIVAGDLATLKKYLTPENKLEPVITMPSLSSDESTGNPALILVSKEAARAASHVPRDSSTGWVKWTLAAIAVVTVGWWALGTAAGRGVAAKARALCASTVAAGSAAVECFKGVWFGFWRWVGSKLLVVAAIIWLGFVMLALVPGTPHRGLRRPAHDLVGDDDAVVVPE